MDGLDHLKNSPALQLLKQLDTPLAIAMTTAAQFDWVITTEPLVTAMKTVQQDWTRDISSMAASWRTAQQMWALEDTPLAKVIEACRLDLTRETASIAAAWKATQVAWSVDATPTVRAIESIKRNWARETASIATSWKSIEQGWALDTSPLARAIEGIQQNLTRDIGSMAKAWTTAQAAWTFDINHTARALEAIQRDWAREATSIAASWKSIQQACPAVDTMPIAAALKAAEAHNTQIVPVWAASISLERIKPSRAVNSPTTQMELPDNSLSNKPFSNYGMAESYDLLSDFERDLRCFIHQRMSAAFGSRWESSRIPGDMYKSWKDKREKAIIAGELRRPLIDYADFTDYVIVITRRDNWEQLFKPCFGRAQFVQESLYRLQPIRVCTMHARVLSREMRLVLQSEIMLLSKRMWN